MFPEIDKLSELRHELEDVRARLAEAEDALNAIRNGDVDGLVMAGPEGQQVFTLKGAQEPYQLLIERMSEGALLLSPEGMVLYANETFAHLIQRPLGQVIGTTFADLILEDDRRLLADLITSARDGIGRGRLSILSAGGDRIPLRLGLSHLQIDEQTLISVVTTDLTEISRKEAELVAIHIELEGKVKERTRDLEASRLAALNIMEDAVMARESVEQTQAELAQLGAAVEQSANSVVITDVNGNIQYVNPAFERVTGYTKEEALNQNPRILKSGRTDPKVYRELWETIVRGGVWKGHLINRRKDGTFFEERVTISPIRDGKSNQIVNFVAVKQDVSDIVQLEEQLRQSQKMEAIGQLAGGVAHDFNNLLTAINGYSTLALQRVSEDTPIKTYLEEIKKAGDRAANLTRQLLAFGRKQILQPVPLNLNDIVTDMNKMLKRLIGEDVLLSESLDPSLKRIKADPGQIEQVLVNLVVNARDAMPQGGKLTIETANVELDGGYASKHVGLSPGSYVLLAVSDTGTGMDETTKTRIFDPFFTTKEKGKGTGLGLSTVYGIVKQSGGNVWVYSEAGRGTTFKVYLPQFETGVKPETPAIEATIPRGSETILLLEDEEMVRSLARQILAGAGYKVVEASRGEEAIKLCTAQNGPIDLLLTDVVMPEMSGKEVADRVSQSNPLLKVLFMSGYTDEAIVHHGVLDANVQFIQKPFTPAGLATKVRQVLDSNGKVTR